jgi:iron complex transport system substrate-binding protein
MKLKHLFLGTIALLAFSQQSSAQRLVSIDGSVTEIIYALGADTDLVAVDTTSRFPSATDKLPKVGYMRALSAEGIIALRPDLILITPDAGPPSALQRLKNMGIRIETIPNAYTQQGLKQKILRVGEVLNKPSEATQLAKQVEKQITEAVASIPTGAKLRMLSLLSAGNHGLSLAGQNTQAQAVLDIIGAENIVQGINGYKPVSSEFLLSAAPDLLVIATHQPGNAVKTQPLLHKTDAWKQQRVLEIDSMMLLGFGPRLPQAIHQIAQAVTQ